MQYKHSFLPPGNILVQSTPPLTHFYEILWSQLNPPISSTEIHMLHTRHALCKTPMQGGASATNLILSSPGVPDWAATRCATIPHEAGRPGTCCRSRRWTRDHNPEGREGKSSQEGVPSFSLLCAPFCMRNPLCYILWY